LKCVQYIPLKKKNHFKKKAALQDPRHCLVSAFANELLGVSKSKVSRGSLWVWDGSRHGVGGRVRRVRGLSWALTLRVGAGQLQKGPVMPRWPLSPMPGRGWAWEAGDLEEIRGEGQRRGGRTHPALSSPLLSLPQAWGQLPSPSATRARVDRTERLAAAREGCSALGTAAALPAGLPGDGIVRFITASRSSSN